MTSESEMVEERKLYKLQWPISSNGANQILVYAEDRKPIMIRITPRIRDFFQGKLKVYAYGALRGGQLFLENEHQSNPGW